MSPSKIEWTDETWPLVTGCELVSEGCRRCYAARDAAGRLSHLPAYAGLAVKEPGEPAVFTGEVRLHPEQLDRPRRWQRPRRVFVCSQADLFHPSVPDEFIGRVVEAMVATPRHSYQVLTKRPQRMRRLFNGRSTPPVLEEPGDPGHVPGLWDIYNQGAPAPNMGLGTSIEDDPYTFRAAHLRATLAAVRFLSLEPLLGPLPSLDLSGIDWVIVGGESGPGARPTHPDWVRAIRDRCVSAGVPFFFKQWGQYRSFLYPGERCRPALWLHRDGRTATEAEASADGGEWMAMHRFTKAVAGRELDGEEWSEMPA